MYYDYRSYLNTIIGLLQDIYNIVVGLDGKVFQILKVLLIGLFTCLGLWSIFHGWRYKA